MVLPESIFWPGMLCAAMGDGGFLLKSFGQVYVPSLSVRRQPSGITCGTGRCINLSGRLEASMVGNSNCTLIPSDHVYKISMNGSAPFRGSVACRTCSRPLLDYGAFESSAYVTTVSSYHRVPSLPARLRPRSLTTCVLR